MSCLMLFVTHLPIYLEQAIIKERCKRGSPAIYCNEQVAGQVHARCLRGWRWPSVAQRLLMPTSLACAAQSCSVKMLLLKFPGPMDISFCTVSCVAFSPE